MLDKKGLGEYLRLKRKERHLSQKLAAYVVNISERALSSIENGRSEPEFKTLCRLCDLYGVSLKEIECFYRRSYDMNYAMNIPLIKTILNSNIEILA